jgi:hypothetical protein
LISRHVSLFEAVDTTHFTLGQAQVVLQREQTDIEEEQQRLMEWGSLLKEWTTSERERAMVKQE